MAKRVGGERKDGRQWPPFISCHLHVTGGAKRKRDEFPRTRFNLARPEEVATGGCRVRGLERRIIICIIEGLRLFWAQGYSRAQ
jgi:hypothetical protein